MDTINVYTYTQDDNFLNSLAAKIESIEGFQLKLKTDNLERLLSEMKKSEPHLLLFDLELTGYDNGLKILNDITKPGISTKIVILMEEEDEKVIYSSICKGVYDYLDKSKPVTNLESKLQEVLKSKTPLAGLVNNKIKKSFETAVQSGNEYNLTDREKEILNLLVGGLTKRKIAQMLVLSYHTIDSHLRNIYRKLGVQSRSQAITRILKGNLVIKE